MVKLVLPGSWRLRTEDRQLPHKNRASRARSRAFPAGAARTSLPAMTDDQFRESRAALILLGLAVLSVLIFGAVTLLIQIE